MILFRRLQTKLTVLYAGMFGAILVLIYLAVGAAVNRNAERMVRGELAANAAVFDRIWSLRSARLREEADVLAHDFGFRAAVATGDVATIRSALENLRSRLGVDAAFVVGLDGRTVSVGAAGPPSSVTSAVQNDPDAAGAFVVGGQPYYGAAAAVMAPAPVGAVVFATRLDRADIAAMQKLSAIAVHSTIMTQDSRGAWRATADAQLPVDVKTVSDFASRALANPAAPSGLLQTSNGPASAMVMPLTSLGGGGRIALLRYYPLKAALAPFNGLLASIGLIGLGGLALLAAGSWALAATLTRPLSALETAVKRLQQGERAQVEIATNDEIARLGSSFNAMAGDIRDREERLERAKTLAEAANRAKSAFLANMSHEVRTPLNGVLGVAGVLSGTALDERQHKMVAIIESSAAALQRVLSDVLDIARLEAGRFDFIDSTFQLGEVVRRLAADAELQAKSQGVAFALALDADADGWVSGDRARLEQMLGALLGNALKFTPDGEIRFGVERADGRCTFTIRDTGVGFDPAGAEQLFQPFMQADQTSTRRYGGAGLGLAIARDLARGMGGELTGTGAVGDGAVFTLTLRLPTCAPGETAKLSEPSAPQAAPPPAIASQADIAGMAAPEQGSAAEGEGGALRVLLADDHATNRTVVQLILESVGVDLVSVENGAEAVEAFKAQDFHVVLMDIQMPVMDGLTAIRLIRDYERAAGRTPTPVVVLSANAMPEHLESSAAAGADDHVAKPVVAPVLLAALDNALALADARAEEPAAANVG